ncbi:putative pentatricopeptide repeat-containing protein At5g08490 [Lactuca sativa]|nr:putative pentatricopeptide repeat-containing protein At5g08490 [Lactuca sativa]
MNKSYSEPNYQTFAATIKSFAAKANIKFGKCLHSSVIKLGLQSCVIVSKSLLNMYAKCKALDDCHILFNQITHPDAVTWNIMLSGLAGTRVHDIEVMKLYKTMNLVQHFKPSSVTVAIVLPVCVRLKGLRLGKSIHSYVIKSGLESQTLVGNALVSLYFKLGCVSGDAYQVFDEVSERDVVSWNAMVAGLVENGLFLEAFSMFRQMIVEGTSPNYATIANILPVSTYHFGKEIHCYTIRREELFLDISIANSLLRFYSNIGQMKEAESLFKRMHSKDLVSWNSMIAGYTSNGEWLKALEFFQKFNSLNLAKPDSVTFLTLLSTCTNLQNLKFGKQIHGYIIRHFNLYNMTSVSNSLINFYSKCGDLVSAFHTFSLIQTKDLISWNSILLTLAEGQLVVDFLDQLHSMFMEGVKPDSITIITTLQLRGMVKEAHGFSLRSHLLLNSKEPTLGNALIDAYSKSENMEYALKVFKNLSTRNIITSNSLLSGYVNSGSHEDASIIFKNMIERDLTTWNLMIRVYAEHGYTDEAVNLLHELQNHEIKPDSMTIMSILPVVNQMVSMDMVKQCHGYVVRACFQDVQLKGALLDSYSKCGSINYACKIFETSVYKDLVMFTSMVGGYSMHGMGEEALRVYFQMLENGGKPDHVVITSVLSGCSHAGLVDQGLKIFDSIDHVHGLQPTMEQYVCVVDLLARNGRINEAYSFIKNMAVEPNANVWGALLGACKNHDDVEMGCVVSDHLLGIEDNNMGNYVVMSNIYAAKDKWDEVLEIRKLMKRKDLKKPAGCSWIEVDGRKNVFIAGDTSHPLRTSIVNMLENFDKQVNERFQLS